MPKQNHPWFWILELQNPKCPGHRPSSLGISKYLQFVELGILNLCNNGWFSFGLFGTVGMFGISRPSYLKVLCWGGSSIHICISLDMFKTLLKHDYHHYFSYGFCQENEYWWLSVVQRLGRLAAETWTASSSGCRARGPAWRGRREATQKKKQG